MKRPILLGTFGHPGSGKTYFSERLAKKEKLFHLSADRIRLKMFKNPKYTLEEHKIVFAFMNYLAEEFLKHGVSVIYDANFNLRKHRQKLNSLAKKANAEYKLVWVKTSDEKAMSRIKKRSKLKNTKKKELYRPIDLKVFKLLKEEMQNPTVKEKVIEINGGISFSKQFESYKKQLRF